MCFARLFFRTDFLHGHCDFNAKHIMVEKSMVQPIRNNMNTRLYSAKRFPMLSACTAAMLMVIASGAAHAQNGAAIPAQGSAVAVDTSRSAARMPIRTASHVIQKVFDDLVDAVDDPAKRPQLIVTNSADVKVANYTPGERIVRVDLRFYEVCRTFGKDSLNALAAVLGHELAHCYRGFCAAREFGNGPYRDRLHRIAHEKIVSEETEADLYGGFYARIAGYDATRVTPEVLEKVYDTFGLPDTLQDYLPKQQRKSIAMRVEDQLRHLLPAFDAANFLALARQYPEAQRCYDHVVRDFPSRELFNNAGAAYALQALDIMDDEDVRYVYPLELDADSRLRGIDVLNGRIDRGTRSPTAADSILIARLLDSAESRFRRARSKDRAYAPAMINLATIYILKHQYRRAIDTAAAAMSLDTSRTTHILGVVVQSIAQARLMSTDKALAGLRSIRDAARNVDASAAVEANLAVLEKRDFHIPDGQGVSSPGETIQGFRGGDTSAITPADGTEDVGGPFGLRIISKRFTDCIVLRAQKDSSWAQVIWTADWYEQSSKRGITIGSTGNDVKRLSATNLAS